MRVNRLDLLAIVDSLKPGVAVKEQEAQSSCIVFKDGYAHSFSGEVAAHRKCDIGITGAVYAKPLCELLNKMVEDDVDITAKDGAELIIKGKGRRAAVRMQADIVLAYDSVETPVKWRTLHEEFNEAVELAQDCASKEVTANAATCVHIHPEYVEACDNYQAIRYPVATGVARSTLIKREAIKHIIGAEMHKMAVTKTWVHFKNPSGLYIACRCYLDEYQNLDKIYTAKCKSKVKLPGGLTEACALAEVFSGENAEMNEVKVRLTNDQFIIRGEGSLGWYTERKKVSYSGPPLEFNVSPKLLTEISNKYNEGRINGEFLKIDTGRYIYITSLGTNKKDDVDGETED